MQTRSIQGNTYIVTYLDNKIGWIYSKFFSEKSQMFKKCKTYQVTFKPQQGIKVKCLKIDEGGKYMNKEAQVYLKEQGIK